MKRPIQTALTTASLAVLLAGPLSAQSWTALGSPNNVSAGQQFWDNTSSDGTKCNAGYVLTGQGGAVGNPCGNQRPLGWLPYGGVAPSYYLNGATGGPQLFDFAAGVYKFGLLGDIAGANGDWGYWDGAHTRHSLNSGPFPQSISFGGVWGLYALLTNGNYAYSDIDPQFALFGFNNTTPFSAGGVSLVSPGNVFTQFVVGIEDIKVTGYDSHSDKDYQDMLFTIQREVPDTPQELLPEPSSIVLLGSGLVGMGLVARRRRRV